MNDQAAGGPRLLPLFVLAPPSGKHADTPAGTVDWGDGSSASLGLNDGTRGRRPGARRGGPGPDERGRPAADRGGPAPLEQPGREGAAEESWFSSGKVLPRARKAEGRTLPGFRIFGP